MLDPKYYCPEMWLEGTWSDAWIRDLPNTYWKAMLDSSLRDFASWVPEEHWPRYLESQAGRAQMSEQLFVRLSQATANFIPWIQERIDLQGLRVLEIGCGTGSSTAALSRAGASVTGLDITESILRVNRTRLASLGLQADLHHARPDWLGSIETAQELLTSQLGNRDYDIVVCYALLEHLPPLERLNLLAVLRPILKNNPDTSLIIYETPNRLAPFDWHSTQTWFPDILPDEIAQEYLIKRLPQAHPWRSMVRSFHTPEGREDWFRAGRGASFHEFDVVFGLENIEVIHDGYSSKCDYIRHFRPNAAYEAALSDAFTSLDPPVPRGFARPTLDLIMKWQAAPGSRLEVVPHTQIRHESEAAFNVFYELGWWGSPESKSGRGSELGATEIVREELATWLGSHPHVKTVLDAPCGDFNWMRVMRWPHPITYLGGDVVRQLILDNQKQHQTADKTFMELDIIADEIPAADMWFCRDALIHFPFRLGALVIEKFIKSNVKYLLSTTFPAEQNDVDCELGGYHKVNLSLAPFNLGPSSAMLRDPAENNQPDRFVGVWLNPKFSA